MTSACQMLRTDVGVNEAYVRLGAPSRVVLPQAACFDGLFTVMRAASTSSPNFAAAARRLMTVLAEETIAQLPSQRVAVETCTGSFVGLKLPDASEVCCVSIVRSGDAFLECVRNVWPAVSVGKILVQRDETTARPHFFFSKLPPAVSSKHILLVDPVLATGGSAVCAIRCLVAAGVDPNKILLVCVVGVKRGIVAVLEAFPDVKIVLAALDDGLDERFRIVPGLGDFGDRFFGTE